MSFRIGQRVRSIASLNSLNQHRMGIAGTIVGPTWEAHFEGYGPLTLQPVRWDDDPRAGEWAGRVGNEPVKCLAPIDDDGDFARFMERVLKPLPEKVLAA